MITMNEIKRSGLVCALGSIYFGDDPKFVEQAFRSLERQDTQFDCYLVVDGPIKKELQTTIERFSHLFAEIFVLSKNRGLHNALNFGLNSLPKKYDWVVRFDADDVNADFRFSELAIYIEQNKYDVVGSHLTEIDENNCVLSNRNVPTTAASIQSMMHRANPFNHPTVAFRIDKVLEVGGYDDMPYFEDWALWAKLSTHDARLINIDKSLVNFRATLNQRSRRRGIQYAKHEVRFFQYLVNLFPDKRIEITLTCLLRVVARLIPTNLFNQLVTLLRRIN